MFKRNRNSFEISWRTNDEIAHKQQENDLEESFRPVRKKDEVAAEQSRRSTPVYKALQYLTCLYLQHSNILLTNNAQCTNLIKWK